MEILLIGTGGLILWPLFGAANQLIAGLALLVVTAWMAIEGIFLWKRAKGVIEHPIPEKNRAEHSNKISE